MAGLCFRFAKFVTCHHSRVKAAGHKLMMNISALAKAEGLELFEAYAELKPAELYKAFVREELPAELREKLQEYLIEKKVVRINAKYQEPAATE